MDLNPLFTASTSFRTGAGELKLFEQVGIDLVHGWLVDPESPEAEVLARTGGDYDSAVMLIAGADHTAKGQLVIGDSNEPQADSSRSATLSEEDRQKIDDGMCLSLFLSCRVSVNFSHCGSQIPGQHALSADLPRSIYPRYHCPAWYPCRSLSESAPICLVQTRAGAVFPRDGLRVSERAFGGVGAPGGCRRRILDVCRFGFRAGESSWR